MSQSDLQAVHEYTQRVYEGEVKHQDALDAALLKISMAAIGALFALLSVESMKPRNLTEQVLVTTSLIGALACIVAVMHSFHLSRKFHSLLKNKLMDPQIISVYDAHMLYQTERATYEKSIPCANRVAYWSFFTYTGVFVAYCLLHLFNLPELLSCPN